MEIECFFFHQLVGPNSVAKLVQVTPITRPKMGDISIPNGFFFSGTALFLGLSDEPLVYHHVPALEMAMLGDTHQY